MRERYAALIAQYQADRPRYSRIRRFWLLDVPFTESGGEITPTQKVRRDAVFRKYADRIASLYEGAGTTVLGVERGRADGNGQRQRDA